MRIAVWENVLYTFSDFRLPNAPGAQLYLWAACIIIISLQSRRTVRNHQAKAILAEYIYTFTAYNYSEFIADDNE